jgi:hypothetical protein
MTSSRSQLNRNTLPQAGAPQPTLQMASPGSRFGFSLSNDNTQSQYDDDGSAPGRREKGTNRSAKGGKSFVILISSSTITLLHTRPPIASQSWQANI